jgi:hypothetical protein
MEIQKGMIISPGDWWFVVVEAYYDLKEKELYLCCICDNANNREIYAASQVMHYMTKNELGLYLADYTPNRHGLRNFIKERKVPHDVIMEVLLGNHDNRFDDMKECI